MVTLSLFIKNLYRYTNNKVLIKVISYISFKLDKIILGY